MVVAAAAISGQFVGGDWYHGMHQPAWNPSAWFMGISWGVMYALMAVSAWIVWENRRGPVTVALGWWLFQLLLGVGWSYVFFGLHRIGWSMGVMALWVISALVVVYAFRFVKTQASALMLPVIAWLVFSWVLNFVQWHLNGGRSG